MCSGITVGKDYGELSGVLDGRNVNKITSFLFDKGGDDMPETLVPAIAGVSKGVVPYGLGFVIEDGREGCIATDEIAAVLAAEPTSQALVFDYLGGDEFNSSPTLAPSRRIVNFADRDLEEASLHPELLALVREKVRPTREALTDQSGADYLKKWWWRYQYSAKDLYDHLRGVEFALAIARVTKHMAFARVPTGDVFNEKLIVLPTDRWEAFCIVQSRTHEVWARFFSSTLEDRLNYTPTDCFSTFAFPSKWEKAAVLMQRGKAYHEYRAKVMVEADQGFTSVYNRFHDPDERDTDMVKLRNLHTDLDRAVLDAYGWNDLPTECEFLLDYEVNEEGSGRKQSPWRYRWPDDVRDEVLARLLELNAERAAQESPAGAGKEPVGSAKRRASSGPEPESLFLTDVER